MNRIVRRSLVLICLVTLLASCAFLYNYRTAGWWIQWYVDDYIQWDVTQQKFFRERLREQLQWHRQTQLPRYRVWVESARTDFAGPLSAAQLRAHAEQLQVFWTDIMVQLQPDITGFLAGLSDRQVQDTLASFRAEHAKLVAEYAELSNGALHKKRRHNMQKAVQNVTGRLDDHQRDLIAAWARELPDSRDAWFASRVRWIDALAQALAVRGESADFAGRIHTLFVMPRDHWDPEYQQVLERNTARTLQLLLDLHASLSPRQRQAADANMQKWLDLIDRLAAGKS